MPVVFARIDIDNRQGFRRLNHKIGAGFEPYTLFEGAFQGMGDAVDAVQGRALFPVQDKLVPIFWLLGGKKSFQGRIKLCIVRDNPRQAVFGKAADSGRIGGNLLVYQRERGVMGPEGKGFSAGGA